ncbi:unnamed protein product [Prunus armeniaca]
MGFRNWKKKDKIRQHIGGVRSVHNQSRQYCLDLMNQKQHIQTVLIKQSDQAHINYHICSTGSLDCVRFLLKQGLPFRGRDESDTSNNKGNYVELLQFLIDHDEKVKAVVLENAPGNLKLIAPTIQKDLVNVCATETIKNIIKDMDDAFFSLLVDESRDILVKEQMAVVFRYVDKKGDVIERFVGIQHVSDTTSNSRKEAFDTLFSREELSISIEDDNDMMELLALVAVAKGNADVATSFTSCNSFVNIVGASCRRRDILRDQLQKDITEALENDNLPTGQGLNQETCLKRADDTRWNSHYATNDLSQALQRKDQDIGNAISLVKDCKDALQNMRDNGFEALLDQVSSFCGKHDIDVSNMDYAYVANWRSHRKAPRITKIHHYRVDIFIQIIEGQLAELNHRFSELLRFAEFYPQEFTPRDLFTLEDQLRIYIHHMRTRSEFSQLKGISGLAGKMVEKGFHKTFNYINLLLTFAFTLSVATASVDRAFSAINVVKGPFRNRMGDQLLSDSLLVYIEKDVFICIDNKTIMGCFQNMKTRRGQL